MFDEMSICLKLKWSHNEAKFNGCVDLGHTKDLDYKDPYSEIDIVFLGFQSCIEKDKSRIDFGVDVLCSEYKSAVYIAHELYTLKERPLMSSAQAIIYTLTNNNNIP